MIPDLFSLAIFVRAIETGSISKAAHQSNIALGAASRRIQILESRYSVKLLIRSAEGVKPTPAGEEVMQFARNMLSEAAKLRAHLNLFTQGIKGRVRVKAITSAITQFLADDIAIFSKKFPEIRIELEENLTAEILLALQTGRVDVGVVIDGLSRDGLTSIEYRRDRLIAIVPSKHPLKAKQVTFSKIIQYDMVGLDSVMGISRLLAHAALVAGEPLQLRAQVQSFEALCKLVQAGLGIGVVPENIGRYFAPRMGLRTLWLTDTWAERRMFVCFRDSTGLSPEALRFVQYLNTKPTNEV
jgi:DNA-binding transcriptional LysR family regulator